MEEDISSLPDPLHIFFCSQVVIPTRRAMECRHCVRHFEQGTLVWYHCCSGTGPIPFNANWDTRIQSSQRSEVNSLGVYASCKNKRLILMLFKRMLLQLQALGLQRSFCKEGPHTMLGDAREFCLCCKMLRIKCIALCEHT